MVSNQQRIYSTPYIIIRTVGRKGKTCSLGDTGFSPPVFGKNEGLVYLEHVSYHVQNANNSCQTWNLLYELCLCEALGFDGESCACGVCGCSACHSKAKIIFGSFHFIESLLRPLSV